MANQSHYFDFILVFKYPLEVSLFPLLCATDITKAYKVGDGCYAYKFFTVVTLKHPYYGFLVHWHCHLVESGYSLLNNCRIKLQRLSVVDPLLKRLSNIQDYFKNFLGETIYQPHVKSD